MTSSTIFLMKYTATHKQINSTMSKFCSDFNSSRVALVRMCRLLCNWCANSHLVELSIQLVGS